MVLMAMKLLTFHDQLIAYFAAHDEHDNFAFIDIIQGTQVSRPQFVVGKWIGTLTLDGLGGRRGHSDFTASVQCHSCYSGCWLDGTSRCHTQYKWHQRMFPLQH